MPYITKSLRTPLDNLIVQLSTEIDKLNEHQVDGALNYTISSLLKRLYGVNYYELNRAIGVLENVKQEYYRRVVAPYEEIKIKENGNI